MNNKILDTIRTITHCRIPFRRQTFLTNFDSVKQWIFKTLISTRVVVCSLRIYYSIEPKNSTVFLPINFILLLNQYYNMRSLIFFIESIVDIVLLFISYVPVRPIRSTKTTFVWIFWNEIQTEQGKRYLTLYVNG